MRKRFFKILRSVLTIGVSVVLAVSILRIVSAGDLSPSVSPAGTLKTLEEIYDPLVGTYDSSSVTASSSGDALEIAKCIITKIGGGSCP